MFEAVLTLLSGVPSWLFFVVTAGIGLYLKGRSDGKGVEKAKQTDESAAARSVADEIDAAVAGREPAKNRERLSKWSR